MEVGLRPNFNKSEYERRLRSQWLDYTSGVPHSIALEDLTDAADYNVRSLGTIVHSGVNDHFRGYEPGNHNRHIMDAIARTSRLITQYAYYPTGAEPRIAGNAYVASEVQLKNPNGDKELWNFYSQNKFKQGLLGIVGNWLTTPEGMTANRKPFAAILSQNLGALHEHMIPFELTYDEAGNPLLYEPTAIADLITFSDITGKNDALCRGCQELFTSVSMHSLAAVRDFRHERSFAADPNGIQLLRTLFDQALSGEVVIQIGEIKTVHGPIAQYISEHPDRTVLSEKYKFDIAHTTMAFKELVDIAYYGTGTNVTEVWNALLPKMAFRLYYQPFLKQGRGLVAGNPASCGLHPDLIAETIAQIPGYVRARQPNS